MIDLTDLGVAAADELAAHAAAFDAADRPVTPAERDTMTTWADEAGI